MQCKKLLLMLHTFQEGMVWVHWWHLTDRNDQVDTTNRTRSFQLNKIQRCKLEVGNLTSGKSSLKDRNYNRLSQTMKIAQLCKQREIWIELHTKILRDSESNFLDLTNCSGHRDMALA